jgi:hypothetical protein
MVALEAFYVLTIALFKVSLGLFFLRILTAPRERRIIYGSLIIFSIWSLGYLFFALFQCGVPSGSRFWENKITDRCGSDALGLGMGYTQAILSAAVDIIFVSLPIPTVWQAKIKTREKWIVICIFAVAIMYVCQNSSDFPSLICL